MRVRDVDPKIKRFFPWSLFLTFAILFALGACSLAQEADAADMPDVKPSYTCEWLREYLTTHTEAEARAMAAELHLPKWLIRKAEKCV